MIPLHCPLQGKVIRRLFFLFHHFFRLQLSVPSIAPKVAVGGFELFPLRFLLLDQMCLLLSDR